MSNALGLGIVGLTLCLVRCASFPQQVRPESLKKSEPSAGGVWACDSQVISHIPMVYCRGFCSS